MGALHAQREAATAYLGDMLELVRPEWHQAFIRFVETGEAEDDFLDYLDQDDQGKEAIEMAFVRQAQGFENLAAELKKSSGASARLEAQSLRSPTAISNMVAAVVEAALQTAPEHRDEVVEKNATELTASMAPDDRNALKDVVRSLDNELAKVADTSQTAATPG